MFSERRIAIRLTAQVEMFSVRDVGDPNSVRPDTQFAIALDRLFQDAVRECYSGALRGNSWNGAFLVDMTGAMALPTQKPELLRMHVRASVRANAAYDFATKGFDAKRLKPETLGELAARLNSMDLETTGILAANGKLGRETGRRRINASEARRKMREALEELEARRLWKVDQEGKHQQGKRYRLLPTPEYLEAWEDIRKGRNK